MFQLKVKLIIQLIKVRDVDLMKVQDYQKREKMN